MDKGPQPGQTASSTLDNKLAAIKAYRRAMGLCFKCGVKWSKDHTCAPEVLHVVETLWDTVADDDCHSSEASTKVAEQLCLALSKAAANGSPASCTVHLRGTIAGILVIMLVDSGSSTSFISTSMVA
jgi:hypothetical protein